MSSVRTTSERRGRQAFRRAPLSSNSDCVMPIPLITVIGLEFGVLLGGAVITETIFSWPGVGRLAVDSIFARDYPVVQAVVLVLASIFVLINITVDVLYTYMDPRIREGGGFK